MATLEMVEQLRQRANVSYDEAKAALDACGDDLLEAVIYLERQGKTIPPQGNGYYSTARTADGTDPSGARQRPPGESFGQMVRRFGRWLREVIYKGNTNQFEVWRQQARTISIPVTVLVLLLLFCPWLSLPLLVIGLFFGCRYRFQGPELENSAVNDVMDSAAQAADHFKNEVIHSEDQGTDR